MKNAAGLPPELWVSRKESHPDYFVWGEISVFDEEAPAISVVATFVYFQEALDYCVSVAKRGACVALSGWNGHFGGYAPGDKPGTWQRLNAGTFSIEVGNKFTTTQGEQR